jgi:hypothetical protein
LSQIIPDRLGHPPGRLFLCCTGAPPAATTPDRRRGQWRFGSRAPLLDEFLQALNDNQPPAPERGGFDKPLPNEIPHRAGPDAGYVRCLGHRDEQASPSCRIFKS